jgi:hypothetical protein
MESFKSARFGWKVENPVAEASHDVPEFVDYPKNVSKTLFVPSADIMRHAPITRALGDKGRPQASILRDKETVTRDQSKKPGQ